MAGKPTHIAYVVTKGKEGSKDNWHEVGAVWPHKNGKGFDLVIPDGISLSGRVTIRENEPKPPKA